MRNMDILKNNRYKIKSSNGTFKNFKAIKRSKARYICDVLFQSGKKISVTPDHLIKQKNKQFISASKLKNGTILLGGEVVKSISLKPLSSFVYDVQSVEDTSEYQLNNNVTVSNCANIPEQIFEEFYSSIYPTISSGTESKFITVSTAKGLNHFYRMWEDSTKQISEFKSFRVDWWDVPGRDEEWKRKAIANLGSERLFNQEFGNDFFSGSSMVIFQASLLRSLTTKKPIHVTENLRVFKNPEPNSFYYSTVDVAEGRDADESVMTIFKISRTIDPNKDYSNINDIERFLCELDEVEVVLIYKTNTESIYDFADSVYQYALKYNEATLLIETNIHDLATIIYREYEYEYIIKTTLTHQKIVTSFEKKSTKRGVKTTSPIKKIGVEMMINLMERGKFIANDSELIKQLGIPPSKSGVYGSRSGIKDDIGMTVILLGWSLSQEGFRELFDTESFIKNNDGTASGSENMILFSNGIDDYSNNLYGGLSLDQIELLQSMR